MSTYETGYKAGKTATLEALRKGIEKFLSDDETEVIITKGEVFVPISAMRKIINSLGCVIKTENTEVK